MNFNSLSFLAFFAIVLAVYFALQRGGRFRLQNAFLIACSYCFYAAWDWHFLGILVWITLCDFFCGLRIHAATGSARKWWLGCSVVSNLSLLCYFKYMTFFETSLLGLLHALGVEPSWPLLKVSLPIGVSFVVFESMSYTIDVYRNELPPERRLPNYALFVAFFPKLVAGPIIRAKTLLGQIDAPRALTSRAVASGAWWILIGYFFKLVVADNLSAHVDQAFATPRPDSGARALLGLYGFALQIFGDFAGYSSIAIGIASLLGFSLPRNFRQPYLVTNPQEFWRHWHISLSTWLRDYLYISLGGNKRGVFATYRNLFLTMLLGGLWHGASWNFVIWGAFHGGWLGVHRAVQAARPPAQGGWRTALKVLFTFHLVCFGWLLFRATSLEQVIGFLSAIASGPWSLRDPLAALLAAPVAACAVLVFGYQALQLSLGDDFAVDLAHQGLRVAFAVLIYFVILTFGQFGIQTFIYFRF